MSVRVEALQPGVGFKCLATPRLAMSQRMAVLPRETVVIYHALDGYTQPLHKYTRHPTAFTLGRERRKNTWRHCCMRGSPQQDSWEDWSDSPDVPRIDHVQREIKSDSAGAVSSEDRFALADLAESIRGSMSVEEEAAEARRRKELSLDGIKEDMYPMGAREKVFLVGAALKSAQKKSSIGYGIVESLEELGRLAETAGLEVVGYTYQLLDDPNPRTYVGTGKVGEIAQAVEDTGAETVVFDDELSPGQMRNLEKALGKNIRLCDRTALILDIFSQRAATREGKLQVELAQAEYQLPRLTRMWSHLERQAGGASGQVKGMGEKQIEVDRRLLRNQAAKLRRQIEEVEATEKHTGTEGQRPQYQLLLLLDIRMPVNRPC
eukprot:jgi/Picre1/31916/NNA_007264.t1